MKKFAKVTTREVLENFQTDSEYGLSGSSVASLKKIHGANKLPEEEKVRKSNSFPSSSLNFLLFSFLSVYSRLVSRYFP